MAGPSEVLSIIDSVITLGKQIKPLLTPQYQDAAKGLYAITDYILTANQLLVSWIGKFKQIDISNQSKKEFDTFVDKYNNFRIGPDYDKVKVHCTELGAIYKKSLHSHLQRLFAMDSDKLRNADLIFSNFANQEIIMSDLVFREILGGLEDAIQSIKNDYDGAESYRTNYLNKIDVIMPHLIKQIDDLRKLRLEFLKLSGSTVSTD